jgi:hypothetical protein
MIAHGLIDTGATLALLDGDDRWHESCVAAFAELHLPLLTSEAVLTELFHLVGPRESDRAWRFLSSGAVRLSPISDDELPGVRTLMTRYRDRPMDFADASLVHIAQRESLSTIFTIDHNDFETYRISGRRRFTITPTRERSPRQ